MNTKQWGPSAWKFLHVVTFNYPEKIDLSDEDHVERMKYTKQLFENLPYTLPCKYCRESFKKFLKRLPIDKHLKTRTALTMWLYKIHNMVNEKLRKQEMKALEAKYHELESKSQSSKKSLSELKTFIKETMITPPNPTFSEVCAKYQAQRASCGGKPVPKTSVPSCRSPTTFENTFEKSVTK